jgi:hypothetical protein
VATLDPDLLATLRSDSRFQWQLVARGNRQASRCSSSNATKQAN